MPLPLGHAALGLAANDVLSGNSFANWRTALYIAVLANFPDLDVLAGLFLHGNGSTFHRGLTHSFLFALLAGIAAANAWRFTAQIPKIGFGTCFLLILSHVLGDLLFTGSPVSFSWPLETNSSQGSTGWVVTLTSVLFDFYKDAGLILTCLAIVVVKRLIMLIMENRDQRVFDTLAFRLSAVQEAREGMKDGLPRRTDR
jgi:membrane-bound metal-dependent hydrolase YbcI (DUF457 family)